jgi:signal transduction histidine kinase
MSENREVLQKKTLREIKLRYLFAVSLIAAIAVTAFLINQSLHQRMKEDFKTINVSGRQRMLSQRIALLVNRQEPQLLRETISEFKNGQNFLVKGRFVNEAYPEVYDFYKGEEGLEELSKDYIALATSTNLSTQQKEELFILSQMILRKYDNVTLTTQHISETEFHDRIWLEFTILGITLMLLLLEIVFIFRPMSNSVRSTFNKINEIEDKSFVNARLALIGEIASGIAHEIKNPLSVILVFAKKLTISGPTKDDELMHSHIYKNAERINKIVKSLTMQSRESSHDEMISAPLNNIVEDAVEMFNSKIMMAKITVTKKLNFEGEINCRQAAISQVIANLMANAIDAVSDVPKFTPREIQIETGVEKNEVFVRINDSGPGVPDALTEKIFESFITTKESGKGTGLGLSISKKIMEEHGGLLSLNSEISNSCFELRFPFLSNN